MAPPNPAPGTDPGLDLYRWSYEQGAALSRHETEQAAAFYKLEYERAATRYENIYQGIWGNFSHFAVLAGAILAFGGDRFVLGLLVFIATFPLTFWYWATYLPLDRYGNLTLNRLRAIEGTVNGRFGTDLGHYKEFDASRDLTGLDKWKYRVRYKVHFVGWVLTISTLLALISVIGLVSTGNPLTVRKPAEVTLDTSAAQQLSSLGGKITELQRTIARLQEDLKRPGPTAESNRPNAAADSAARAGRHR